LTEHGAADAGGFGEVVEGPAMFCAESSEALAEGIFWGRGGGSASGFCRFLHVFEIVDDSSCIVD
jgi:hypothetical protein